MVGEEAAMWLGLGLGLALKWV